MDNWCYVFGGSTLGYPYLEAIKGLGYKIHLFDRDRSCPGIKLADDYRHMGYDDLTGIALFAWSRPDFQPGDRVFTAATHHAHIAAGYFRDKVLQVHGVDVEHPGYGAALGCCDKVRFYELCARVGVEVPPYNVYPDTAFHLLEPINRPFYLKSDFGTMPRCCWRVDPAKDLPRIPSKRTAWFRGRWIAQKEIKGWESRVNIWPNDWAEFRKCPEGSPAPGAAGALRRVAQAMGVEKMLVKFDVILERTAEGDAGQWYVLDAGLGPPNRMRKEWPDGEIEFCKWYVRGCLQGNWRAIQWNSSS